MKRSTREMRERDKMMYCLHEQVYYYISVLGIYNIIDREMQHANIKQRM